MKTVKILLFFVVAVAFLSGCSKDEPTIKFEPNRVAENVDFSLSTTYPVLFDVIVNAEAGIKTFKITETTYTGETVKNVIEVNGAEGYSGNKDYTYRFEETYTQSFFEGLSKVEISFEVVDKKDNSVSKIYTLYGPDAFTVTFVVKDGNGNNITDAVVKLGETTHAAGDYTFEVEPGTYSYTVTKEGHVSASGSVAVTNQNVSQDVVLNTLLSTPAEHMWTRTAAQESPYEPVGLKFGTNDTKADIYAYIVRNTASKLVDLSSHFGEITTKEQLKDLIENGTNTDPIKKIVVNGVTDRTYEIALGTKVGEEYYLVNITRGQYSTGGAGTTVTVTTTWQK